MTAGINMEKTEVILVDENDTAIGHAEKMLAHRQGLLHRAFSIFIFTSDGKMLLQQRALTKYHSGGLWTNACCSHPLPGEDTHIAAIRRLKEELGIETEIKKVFDFIYTASFGNGLVENEFDHVFAGIYNGPTRLNAAEVMDTCYKSMAGIKNDLQNYPHLFTAWFHLAFTKIETWWNNEFTLRKH